ncbi:class I SAM-dependent methyltransferase [Actinoplanes sp. NPDC049265]|uniref:class I SAM-dependent methyltransferase n=1 Tax=Actinoplanes sp. NPDC049265 TaxID=3363902 RepID=UPI00371CDED4
MSAVEWVREFYTRTGEWWGAAEADVTDTDRQRAARISQVTGHDEPLRVLELGSGYGGAAVATAQAGHTVTAIELTDRARHTPRLAAEHDVTVDLIRGDFHTADTGGRFDVVTYWDGFGVGGDDDQRRLLTRIARDWLAPGGAALIDVYDPFAWAAQHGTREHRDAQPDDGYPNELERLLTFDQPTCTATDTWWVSTRPHQPISQRLRCYTPADLALLLTGTGLNLTGTRQPLDPDDWSYLAVLR